MSDVITNFDPNRKKEKFTPVPNVGAPNVSILDMDPGAIASILVKGNQNIPINDAPKIADKLAKAFLELGAQYQMVMSRCASQQNGPLASRPQNAA